MEAVATDLLERKALDLIIASATYEDYELKADEQQGEVATVEQAALPVPEEKPADRRRRAAEGDSPKADTDG